MPVLHGYAVRVQEELLRHVECLVTVSLAFPSNETPDLNFSDMLFYNVLVMIIIRSPIGLILSVWY